MSTDLQTYLGSINSQLDTPQVDPLFLGIANKFLAGETVSAIATEYRLPDDRVTSILEKREVKSYIDGVYTSQGYMNRMKRLELINRVVEAKVQEAILTDEFSKKDLLDWMKLLNDMEAQAKPKASGPAIAVQVNNYDRLMKDLING